MYILRLYELFRRHPCYKISFNYFFYCLFLLGKENANFIAEIMKILEN